jgi:hypothetical protein
MITTDDLAGTTISGTDIIGDVLDTSDSLSGTISGTDSEKEATVILNDAHYTLNSAFCTLNGYTN